MDESDPAFLHKQADKCRRLADTLFDAADSEKLRELAREFEAKAREAERQLGKAFTKP